MLAWALSGLAAWLCLVLCLAAVLLATIARASRRRSDAPLLVRGPEMRTVVMPPEPLAQRRSQLALRPRPDPGALRQGKARPCWPAGMKHFDPLLRREDD